MPFSHLLLIAVALPVVQAFLANNFVPATSSCKTSLRMCAAPLRYKVGGGEEDLLRINRCTGLRAVTSTATAGRSVYRCIFSAILGLLASLFISSATPASAKLRDETQPFSRHVPTLVTHTTTEDEQSISGDRYIPRQRMSLKGLHNAGLSSFALGLGGVLLVRTLRARGMKERQQLKIRKISTPTNTNLQSISNAVREAAGQTGEIGKGDEENEKQALKNKSPTYLQQPSQTWRSAQFSFQQ